MHILFGQKPLVYIITPKLVSFNDEYNLKVKTNLDLLKTIIFSHETLRLLLIIFN